MRILFAIPDSRLIDVYYRKEKNGTLYSARIPNPENNDGLVVALLPRKIGLSQIQSLRPVKEWVPPAR